MDLIIKGMATAAFNTLLLYFLLIIGVRTLGRRQADQLTALDLLIVLLLGSAVETALIGPSIEPTKELFHDPNVRLEAGLVSAGTLLFANYMLNRLMQRSKRLRRFISGGPLMLIHDGVPIMHNLRRAGMTMANLEQSLRGRGFSSAAEARFAVLEPDGQVHILPMEVEYRRKISSPNKENG